MIAAITFRELRKAVSELADRTRSNLPRAIRDRQIDAKTVVITRESG